MSRPIDPEAPYRMRIHRMGKYVYASTQPGQTDPKTGKRTHAYAHWGRLDPETNRFIPNEAFRRLSEEERGKFIFPGDWDLSELDAIGTPESDPVPMRLAGDSWFLEQISHRIGLTDDLLAALDGDAALVNQILTLAIFPMLTGFLFPRLARWQRIARMPADIELTPERIERAIDAVTPGRGEAFLRLRRLRPDAADLRLDEPRIGGGEVSGWAVVAITGSALMNHVVKVHGQTALREIFSSPEDMFDEMRTIRCIERPGCAPVLERFNELQTFVCAAFGIEVPPECRPE
ncbi:hypothetical protein [Sutterella sp.]|uniref:hypothetical protein n=1 Tax=Sutterella sp. TaxID=1981025 RepID=UPI0026DF3D20|nr:hypothetical protein [Sutterella sp.]MDO5532012.1 hypothetical protein [Sutterella sp.]